MFCLGCLLFPAFLAQRLGNILLTCLPSFASFFICLVKVFQNLSRSGFKTVCYSYKICVYWWLRACMVHCCIPAPSMVPDAVWQIVVTREMADEFMRPTLDGNFNSGPEFSGTDKRTTLISQAEWKKGTPNLFLRNTLPVTVAQASNPSIWGSQVGQMA